MIRDKRGYLLRVEWINEKKWKRREKAARLERGNPSYQFQPALHRLSVGSETPPPAFKAHERSPADHSQSATVCSSPALPEFTPLQWLSHSTSKTLPLSGFLSVQLMYSGWHYVVWPLIFLWKSGKHSTLMNAQNGCLEGGEKVWIVWSFDIINYKAITLNFKVSSYWRFCLQSV